MLFSRHKKDVEQKEWIETKANEMMKEALRGFLKYTADQSKTYIITMLPKGLGIYTEWSMSLCESGSEIFYTVSMSHDEIGETVYKQLINIFWNARDKDPWPLVVDAKLRKTMEEKLKEIQ